jgi:hypothetical protein
VRRCLACDCVKATFNAHQPVLRPLPIEGMFYRLGVDLCGPFRKTPRGHAYVMVCIEYMTRWVTFVPIPAKSAMHTSHAFAQAHPGRLRRLCRGDN